MIPDQRDLANWLSYHNTHYRKDALTEEQAWPIYYPCNCETCAQRKRIGYHPFKVAGERPGCTAPHTPITIDYVRSVTG